MVTPLDQQLADQQDSDSEQLLRPRKGKMSRRRIITAGAVACLVFLFWFIPFVPALKWDKVNVTRWEKVRGKVQVDVGPTIKGWVPLKNVSRHVAYAIVSAEDGRFYTHPGIDIVEIKKSLETNIEKGRMARGGSTISQQVVKMAFLSREKTLIRKAREVVGTLLLETILSKDEIMEWYLNLAEFGDAVYGIEKASWHYFRTKPQLLSIEQAVHLALVLPSPNGWSKGLRRKNLTRFGHQRFRTILNTMRADGYITKSQQQEAMARGNFGSPINGYISNVPEDPVDEVTDTFNFQVGDPATRSSNQSVLDGGPMQLSDDDLKKKLLSDDLPSVPNQQDSPGVDEASRLSQENAAPEGPTAEPSTDPDSMAAPNSLESKAADAAKIQPLREERLDGVSVPTDGPSRHLQDPAESN